MRKVVGLVFGLLLCAAYQGQAVAKKRQPPTRSQALANCREGPAQGDPTCYKLIRYGEAAFEAGRWHPKDGPYREKSSGVFWADCGDTKTGTSFGRWYGIQCAYLSNIDNDAEFKAFVRDREEAKKEAARRAKAEKEKLERQKRASQEEWERRQPCDKVWSAYVEPIKQKFDSSRERYLYKLPEAAIVPAWELQRVLDEKRADAVSMLKKPANAEEQLGTYVDLLYYNALAQNEKYPDACSEYRVDASGYDKETGKALNARLAELFAQVEARIAEIKREGRLNEAHERKLRSAIKRAGAKADAWYLGLAYSVAEYGMAEVRGHAAFLQDEDDGFGVIQILPNGKALFDGSFSFTVMVVGIKTANLMHGTALTDIGLHWVKVLGFVNYTNPMGGQAQAVKVKPLRNIPHPERGEKLK